MLNYKEIVRQLIHFSGVLYIFIPQGWDLLLTGSVIIILAIAAYVIGMLIEDHVKSGTALTKTAAQKLKRFMIGIAERENVILLKGAMIFFMGIGTTMIVFSQQRDIAMLSILCLAVGDSLSTMVGIHLGTHKMPRNKKKSWEGTLAGVAGILIIGGFFFRPQMVLIAAIVAMFVEAYVKKIDDNFAIPLITGAVLYGLQTVFVI